MTIVEEFLEISRHENDDRVAIAQSSQDLIEAVNQDDIEAVIYDGFDATDLNTYFSSLTEEEIRDLSVAYTILKAGENHEELRERLPAPLFSAIDELSALFFEASGEEEISFKLGYFSNAKMHPHFSDQMTFAFDKVGTEWENGTVDQQTPFFMKSNFLHKTPDIAKQNPRPIMVFSAPSSYGL